MSTLLYIKANPKEDKESSTFQMSESFIKEYRKANPQDDIITLDLYREDIQFLNGIMLADMFTRNDTIMHKYARQFAEADKYVFAAPLWNLGIPAILKAYFDYITLKGVTFYYAETGAVGMLADKGKKAAYIVSRGGDYDEEPMASFDIAKQYITTILGFMGVRDIITVSMDKANVLAGEALEKALQDAIYQAQRHGATF